MADLNAAEIERLLAVAAGLKARRRPEKLLAGKTLAITDVVHPETPARTVTVGADGSAEFEIPNAADYRILRYEVK